MLPVTAAAILESISLLGSAGRQVQASQLHRRRGRPPDRGPSTRRAGLDAGDRARPRVIGYDEAAKVAKEAHPRFRVQHDPRARPRTRHGPGLLRPRGDDRAGPRRRPLGRLTQTNRGSVRRPANRRHGPARCADERGGGNTPGRHEHGQDQELEVGVGCGRDPRPSPPARKRKPAGTTAAKRIPAPGTTNARLAPDAATPTIRRPANAIRPHHHRRRSQSHLARSGRLQLDPQADAGRSRTSATMPTPSSTTAAKDQGSAAAPSRAVSRFLYDHRSVDRHDHRQD